MSRFVASGAFAAALLTLAMPARAQNAAAAPSPSPSPATDLTLQQIGSVTTADRHSEPIGQDSKPTFIVDRQRIDDLGSRTVADALVGVPGLSLFPNGPFGAQVGYSIRGSSSDQVLVLVDGFPVTDPTTGAVQLGQFSTIGVSRIEVVESGSSSLYGTNAAGGVINIITSVPRGEYLLASAGSYGDRDFRLGFGIPQVGFTLERHVATNDYPYPTFDYGPGVEFPSGTRAYSYGDMSAGRLNFDVPLPAGFVLRGRLDASATNIGVPGSLEFPTTAATQDTSSDSALLDIERETSNNRFTLSLSGSQTRLTYVEPEAPVDNGDVYTGRTQVSLKDVISGKLFDATIGIDLSRSTGAFGFPAVPQPSASPIPAYGLGAAQAQSAAYLQVGLSPFAGSRFTVGLRGENDSPAGSLLAPSLGGVITSGTWRFAGNVGESYIVPNLDDLYFPGFSNPNLLPEKAQTADVTIAYQTRPATVSLGWFDRNGSNFIVFAPPDFLPENAQRASTAGIAVTATSQAYHGLALEASYTDLYLAIDQVTGARLPHNPVGQLTLALTHPFGNTQFAYGFNWLVVGSDGDDASNVPALASTYDSYATLNAYVRYKLAPSAILTVRGLNLENTQYAPIFAYPAPGRTVYVELSTR